MMDKKVFMLLIAYLVDALLQFGHDWNGVSFSRIRFLLFQILRGILEEHEYVSDTHSQLYLIILFTHSLDQGLSWESPKTSIELNQNKPAWYFSGNNFERTLYSGLYWIYPVIKS